MKFAFDAVDVVIDGVEIVRNLTLSIDQRRVGIIGDNGSGKSTLARLMNGLVVPTRGRVRVDDLDTVRDGDLVRRKVGFVFQNADNQLVMPTVIEDVAFGLGLRGRSPDDAELQARDVLARLGIAALADRACHVLSGGEKQLVALAGVLAMEPQAIIFDEPTTMLDRRNAAAIMKTIRDLDRQVIVVTHHVELLDGFDRVVVLNNGCVVADAEPAVAIAAYLATHT